ncbi:bifunctional UDP-N-acetylglucosamine diphosphorylase/glucosamine-1-phosphate N-acetyltransferase GlmU [Hippea jasoniae]|uniref:bifunctional UDP-N-acetylglucosamine diphosphorylase/glucosamine-1-phosphate N-acetyltransferase GlmU n=1 Tax=Hippea jasoniae TaxID=944479 RepID=UPI00054F4728|nr:bifunctional UDP-N-acetylglucosamine diphosphorylase/glucosamine-1-phosphate N-acetyltransferase GlmU [Hippea jasoniae]
MDAVILAAGKSTRMKSKTSKIFHEVCGRPLIFYVVEALKNFKIHIIANPLNHEHLKNLFNFAKIHIQNQQKGTLDAVKCAIDDISSPYFAVVNADTPLIDGSDIEAAFEIAKTENSECVLITAVLDDPYGYGRIVQTKEGLKIVEEKEATEEIKKIKEINSGIYIFKTESFKKVMNLVKPSQTTGELYLPDVVGLLKNIKTLKVNARKILGVNTKKQLAEVRRIIQQRILDRFDDVSFVDPDSTYINYDVKIGSDTIIFPGVNIRGNTKIGRDCIIENGSVIENSIIGDNVHIKPYSVIEESCIANNCQIGPFAHLRPLSRLSENVRIGNFVETKKVEIGKGSKASHLTYLGDAKLGEDVNVGCGTITCNYDGYQKNETIIGDRVFIGSDVQLVAPVKVGDDALIAAGTTVTKDVEPFALAISRVPQTNKKDWVKKYRKAMEEKLGKKR